MRRMIKPTMAALIAVCMGLGLTVAEAGKPSSGSTRPLVLTGTGGYTETAVFDTTYDVRPAVQDIAAMADVDQVAIRRGIEVDGDGAVYVLFWGAYTSDTVQPSNANVPHLRQEFSGIVRHDASGTEVVLSTDFTYDGGTDPWSVEAYSGEEWIALDRVPEILSTAPGALREGDLVGLRWVDEDTGNTTGADDAIEVVHLRPTYVSGAFSELDERGVLYTFAVPGSDGGLMARVNVGQVAADPYGRVYVCVVDSTLNASGGTDLGLWMLTEGTSAWTATDVAPPFAFGGHIDVDKAGNLYVQGRDFGTDGGVIFQLAYEDDPDTDYTSYASFGQTSGSNCFQAWAYDGVTFAIGLQKPPTSKPSTWNVNYFIGLVSQGETTAFADRIADTTSDGVQALTADADGAIYAVHIDRSFNATLNRYEIARYTVYKLEGSGDTGGGDTGDGGDTGTGGGGGKGKGKKK